MADPLGCNFPFEYLFLGLHHVYTTCCVCWVTPRFHQTQPIVSDAWSVWNCPAFMQLRARILTQEWSACTTCPRIPLGHVHPRPIPPEWKPRMEVGPKTIVLGNDRACNLHCWICRQRPEADTDPQIAKNQQMILDAFLPAAEQLSFSHSGDPFVSPLHRPLLDLDPAGYPGLKIELFTNGQRLADEWAGIRCRPLVHRLMISVDAGTRETYRQVRGGDWHRLIAGLCVIAEEREQRKLDLWLNMTVSAANWSDIPSFIALGRRFEADRIEIKPFLPQWHNPEQYSAANVCDPQHPEHDELLQLVERNREELDQVDAKQLLVACGL